MGIVEIKQLMLKKGCSIQQLADALDMQYCNIAMILQGKRAISKSFLEKALFFLLSN